MLISRSEAKLKAVQAEIAEQYPSVKVDYAVALTLTLTPNPNLNPNPNPNQVDYARAVAMVGAHLTSIPALNGSALLPLPLTLALALALATSAARVSRSSLAPHAWAEDTW